MSKLIWISDGKQRSAVHKTCTFAIKPLKRGCRMSSKGTFRHGGSFTVDFWGSEQACKGKAEEVVQVYEKVMAE